MTTTKTLALVMTLASAMTTAALTGCSSDSNNTEPADPNLSQGYAKQCNRCHGPRGEGTSEYPRIPGKKDTPEAYITYVRQGKGEMPPFSATQITDTELRADWTWLTNVRGK